MRGTYKPSVHGPLPAGVIPLPRQSPLTPRGALATPAQPPPVPDTCLTADDCPPVLTEQGKTLWRILVTQRPTEKILGPFVAMYIEAWLAWQRATEQIQQRGDFGKINDKPTANPFLRLRREHEATCIKLAQMLGWQAPGQLMQLGLPAEPPQSRLELFLSARRRA